MQASTKTMANATITEMITGRQKPQSTCQVISKTFCEKLLPRIQPVLFMQELGFSSAQTRPVPATASILAITRKLLHQKLKIE